MPELAEVALYARDLNGAVKNCKVEEVSFFNRDDWGSVIVPEKLKKALRLIVGQRVAFESAGKALYLKTYKDDAPIAEFRLGMTGQFHSNRQSGLWKRHYFLKIRVGDRQIYYADPRRFGRVQLPVSSELALGGFRTEQGFWSCNKIELPGGYLSAPKITWLLAHGDKTGVGNYMANEALGRLNLSPYTPCENQYEAAKILKKCLSIAKSSFKYEGNSFGSGYFLLNGQEGQYAKYCKFYGNPEIKKQIYKGRPIFSNFNPHR